MKKNAGGVVVPVPGEADGAPRPAGRGGRREVDAPRPGVHREEAQELRDEPPPPLLQADQVPLVHKAAEPVVLQADNPRRGLRVLLPPPLPPGASLPRHEDEAAEDQGHRDEAHAEPGRGAQLLQRLADPPAPPRDEARAAPPAPAGGEARRGGRQGKEEGREGQGSRRLRGGDGRRPGPPRPLDAVSESMLSALRHQAAF
ncbi:hypothetical protein THAOC_29374, partial [Thalassiosira oceanica]